MSSLGTRRLFAWLVHALTLTGIVWATLALLALMRGEEKLMWLYLGIALVVDGVDGTLARKADVKTHAPGIDGVVLDTVADYLTWTFIPALFMYRAGLLGPDPLGVILLLVINVTSMFCYANTKMKTDDFYFMGFPAAWNVIALMLWFLQLGTPANAIVVLIFSVLTWAPITFVHPFRVAKLMPLNILATAVWVLTSAHMVITFPELNPVSAAAWTVSGAWLVLVGLIRTVMAKRASR